MNGRKRILFISIAFCMVFILCGFGSKPSIEMDTEKIKVHKVYSIEDIIKTGADDNFNLCCVKGKIIEISKNKEKIYISNGISESRLYISTSDVVEKVEKLKPSDSILVYGKAKKSLFDNEFHVIASNISSIIPSIKDSNIYCMESGSTISKSAMVECTLDSGHIKYYVPKSWKSESVELNIEENGLGHIDGYQYVLNKIPGSDENTPESFFVCYFKYEGNLRKDTNKSKVKPIEKAIVETIEDASILKFPSYEKLTYYGAKYQYYQGIYNDHLQVNDDYYTEYVFQQDGEKGIVMYLYVYKKAAHIDDIMYVTRFLQIN